MVHHQISGQQQIRHILGKYKFKYSGRRINPAGSGEGSPDRITKKDGETSMVLVIETTSINSAASFQLYPLYSVIVSRRTTAKTSACCNCDLLKNKFARYSILSLYLANLFHTILKQYSPLAYVFFLPEVNHVQICL